MSQTDDKKYIEDCVFDIQDALTSPMIVFDQMWADTIPQRIKDIIPIARMKGLMKGHTVATYAEALAYLYCRCLIAPMDYQWTNIYCYVSCMVLKHYFQEDHFKEMGVTDLSSEEKNMLEQLRRKIYNKRREQLKKHIKDGKRNEQSRGSTVQQSTKETECPMAE